MAQRRRNSHQEQGQHQTGEQEIRYQSDSNEREMDGQKTLVTQALNDDESATQRLETRKDSTRQSVTS